MHLRNNKSITSDVVQKQHNFGLQPYLFIYIQIMNRVNSLHDIILTFQLRQNCSDACHTLYAWKESDEKASGIFLNTQVKKSFLPYHNCIYEFLTLHHTTGEGWPHGAC